MNVPKGDARCNPSKVTVVQKGNKPKKQGLTLKKFLESKHITMAEFRQLDAWKQEEWRRQHQEAHRREQIARAYDESEERDFVVTDDDLYEDAMELLDDCGVPFGPDGEPLGIGW